MLFCKTDFSPASAAAAHDPFVFTFAQLSRRPTVRLKTGLLALPSTSGVK